MVRNPGKKQSCLVIALILVLAISGIFAFSLSENLLNIESAKLDGNKPFSNGIITPVDFNIDWLAGEAGTITKANKVSSSPLRSGALRVLTSVGLRCGDEYITVFSLRAAITNQLINSYSPIQLKLRI
jgi:hypothetical protein